MKTNNELNLGMAEERILTDLHEAIYALADEQYAKQDNDPAYDEQAYVTITVADEEFNILLGGPQLRGLSSMIEHICDENGYAYPVRECDK